MRDQMVGLAVTLVLGAIAAGDFVWPGQAAGQELVGVGQRRVGDFSRVRGP